MIVPPGIGVAAGCSYPARTRTPTGVVEVAARRAPRPRRPLPHLGPAARRAPARVVPLELDRARVRRRPPRPRAGRERPPRAGRRDRARARRRTSRRTASSSSRKDPRERSPPAPPGRARPCSSSPAAAARPPRPPAGSRRSRRRRSTRCSTSGPATPPRPGRPTKVSFVIRQPDGTPLTHFKTGPGPAHRRPPDHRAGRPRVHDPPAPADREGRDRERLGRLPRARQVPRRRRRVPGERGAAELPALPHAPRRRPVPAEGDPAAGERGRRRRLPLHARRRLAPEGACRRRTSSSTSPTRTGSRRKFTPWYGALAHAIFFRHGSLDYFHTHVCAPGATGCTSILGGAKVTGTSTTPGKLTVGVLVPAPGTWRLFLQTRVDGRVLTAPFTLKVSLMRVGLATAARGDRRARARPGRARRRRPGERLPDHAAGVPAVRREGRQGARGGAGGAPRGREQEGLPDPGRRDLVEDRPRRGAGPLPQAADLREVPRPGALLLLQALAARGDAERVRRVRARAGAEGRRRRRREAAAAGSTDGNTLVAAADRAVRTLARRRGLELSATPVAVSDALVEQPRPAPARGRRCSPSLGVRRRLGAHRPHVEAPVRRAARARRARRLLRRLRRREDGGAGVPRHGPLAGAGRARVHAHRPGGPAGEPRLRARPLRRRHVPLHALPRRLPRDRRQPQPPARDGDRPPRRACACSRSASTRRGDTPAAVRRFVREHRLVPAFRYLTGSHAQLAPVWHGLPHRRDARAERDRRALDVRDPRRPAGAGAPDLRRAGDAGRLRPRPRAAGAECLTRRRLPAPEPLVRRHRRALRRRARRVRSASRS